jgi:hypothetical protein
VITLYLLPEVNLQLRPKLLQLRPGTRVVSHDFDMGDWNPDKTVVVDAPDKPIGLEKKSRVHLWVVPARVEGLWCGTGKAKGRSLSIAQRYQDVRVDIPEAGAVRALEGKAPSSAPAAAGSTSGSTARSCARPTPVGLRRASRAQPSRARRAKAVDETRIPDRQPFPRRGALGLRGDFPDS